MCRNIRTLFNFEPKATDDEVRASALQFVRKISGLGAPSKANEAAFAHAVDRVSQAARDLLDALVTTAAPRDREVEKRKAKERAAKRFGKTLPRAPSLPRG
ncbi:MAG TPA: DUF2277 domain-containing protein [Planctomycetota bacterium]|nr:DUF2277 domain-containing protein [Planctomycetota bacterium]